MVRISKGFTWTLEQTCWTIISFIGVECVKLLSTISGSLRYLVVISTDYMFFTIFSDRFYQQETDKSIRSISSYIQQQHSCMSALMKDLSSIPQMTCQLQKIMTSMGNNSFRFLTKITWHQHWTPNSYNGKTCSWNGIAAANIRRFSERRGIWKGGERIRM